MMRTSGRLRAWTGRSRFRRADRPAVVVLLALVMVASGLSVGVPAAAADPTEKIESQVRAQLAEKGEATAWVLVKGGSALGPAAAGIRDRAQRGRFVFDELRQVAAQSQAGIVDLLTRQKVGYRSFWAVNTVKVTANARVLRDLAARPEVERVVADGSVRIPEPKPATAEPGVNTVEWNIDRIGAPQVWQAFDDRGEGIVVADIYTGVQFDPPALVNQYRGNRGGSFDHNYNWFDPSNVCGNPSLVPCDNVGHGTHTMGTMVGSDGDPGPNQIGVAPGARWMTAKGCEGDFC